MTNKYKLISLIVPVCSVKKRCYIDKFLITCADKAGKRYKVVPHKKHCNREREVSRASCYCKRRGQNIG